jgi:hypothetical protein
MWTPTTRRHYSRDDLRSETDLTDAEWALIEPHMPKPRIRGRPREWPLREVLNAIFYVLRGGVAWRLLPNDLPPRTTVFRWFCAWRASGHPRLSPRLPLRRLSHAPHTPIGPPVMNFGPNGVIGAPA